MHDTDQAAVSRAAAGDAEAFRALVERHSRYVYQLAHRMTGSVQDAEDVVQEAFLKAHRQLGRFESRAGFRTWIHRIAVNCSIDLIRARRTRELAHDPADIESGAAAGPVSSADPLPDRLLFGVEIREQVTAALGLLTAAERAAFMLRHVEGRSIREVGEALGLKPEATKNSVFRAVRKLRAALAPVVRSREGATEMAEG
ncbi:MAG: RNA polymerase sigma factor [Vicinamibacterales bacterium]